MRMIWGGLMLVLALGLLPLRAQAPDAAAAGGAPIAAPARGEVFRVDVFTQDGTPIAAGSYAMSLEKAGTLAIYNLDDMAKLNDRLGQGLPNNETQAKAMVAQRVNALSEAQIADYAHAANGQARADSFKISRTPAVVINEKHVYYGASSVEFAIGAYRKGL